MSAVPGPDAGGRRAGRETLPFIGRHAEREWLAQRLDEAVSGIPRLALISGDAGIGKTRLVNELRPRFENVTTILFTHCYEQSQPPYLPFALALQTCAARIPGLLDEAGEDDRASLVPLLGAPQPCQSRTERRPGSRTGRVSSSPPGASSSPRQSDSRCP